MMTQRNEFRAEKLAELRSKAEFATHPPAIVEILGEIETLKDEMRRDALAEADLTTVVAYASWTRSGGAVKDRGNAAISQAVAEIERINAL